MGSTGRKNGPLGLLLASLLVGGLDQAAGRACGLALAGLALG
jgi:hypothetical protein